MRFRDLIDRHYNGDPNQRDYCAADQPRTRGELFKTVLSVRLGNMPAFSIAYALAWFPAIIWTLISLLQAYALITASDIIDPMQLHSIALIYTLVMAPLIALTGPFVLASSYVMRNWARDAHADLAADYRRALKENWKQGLIYGLVNGILFPIAYTLLSTYYGKAQANAIFYLPISLLVLLLLVWQLCCMVIPTMCVTYDLSFRQIVQNAFIISFLQFFRAAGIWLLFMLLPILTVLLCCFNISALRWLLPALIVYKVMLGFALKRLAYASYANMVCEKYINSRIEGAPTDIGLH